MRLHSYSSVFALGHRAVAELLRGGRRVVCEEKVDGSQITFGVVDGELAVRSKGAELFVDAPEKMFAAGIEKIAAVRDLLTDGLHYRGEYLQKPKHNTLAYERTPKNHIVIFDVDDGQGRFLTREEKAAEAERLGFDLIPELYRGAVEDETQLRGLLDAESYLGGTQIEGVVIKPEARDLFGLDKKLLMAKFVRDDFQEMNSKEFRKSNPTKSDVIQFLGEKFRNEARWAKAVQHLRERGAIDGTLRDIGSLIKEIPADIEKEATDEIKERLFAWAWPQIRRISVAGLPEWYKQKLVTEQFDSER